MVCLERQANGKVSCLGDAFEREAEGVVFVSLGAGTLFWMAASNSYPDWDGYTVYTSRVATAAPPPPHGPPSIDVLRNVSRARVLLALELACPTLKGWPCAAARVCTACLCQTLMVLYGVPKQCALPWGAVQMVQHSRFSNREGMLECAARRGMGNGSYHAAAAVAGGGGSSPWTAGWAGVLDVINTHAQVSPSSCQEYPRFYWSTMASHMLTRPHLQRMSMRACKGSIVDPVM